MPSKPLRPWSKRQSGPEASPRIGGLLPILKHRASRLVLLPSDDKQNASSPVTTYYDTALANAVGNLHTAVNGMLVSRSSSVNGPPRSRPRSTSVPLVVELPAEFPGSAMLKDRVRSSASAPVLTTPSVKATHNESQQPRMQPDYEEVAMNSVDRGVPKSIYARGMLARSSSYSVKKKNHANHTPIPNDIAPLGTPENFKEATSSEPSPITHNEHTWEPDSNNTHQDHAILTLKSQFDNSREACESHVNALKRWHSVQVASSKTRPRLCKERANKQSLQVTTSGDWLAGLCSDGSLHARDRERVEKSADVDPADLNTSSRCESAGQQLSHQQLPDCPQTENLKHKSLGAPGLRSTTHCLLSESSLYEQDRAALQKQIDLLTAKLSTSSKNERELRSVLAMAKRENADKAMHANKLAEKIQALHNTVAHLENRLEIANMKRIDAEEQLLARIDQKSPFDLMELQPQAKKKNACIAGLEAQLEQLQEKYNQLQHEHKRVAVQLDLQDELLRETRTSDKVIEQLRIAVINHESTIMENEQTIHGLRRQLDHHKLLLQAEIRRHAAMKLYVAAEEYPLPELTSLAKREDIDCWMEKLHERLRREQSKSQSKAVADTLEAKIESLRHEINFYISEIILFKLDIKGYRSDIRRLKEMTAHQGSSHKLADIAPRPSSSGTMASPVESSFAPITPELDAFLGASSVMGHTDTVSRSEVCSITPSSSVRLSKRTAAREGHQLLELETNQNFRNSGCNHSSTSKVARVDSAFSQSSNALQVSEHLTTPYRLNCFNKRSMSAPPLWLHQWPVTLDRPTTGERGTTSKAEREATSYRRCIAMSDALESPVDAQLGSSQLMGAPNSNEEIAPTLSGPYETPTAYVAPESPVESISETDSVLSTASDYLARSAPVSEGTLGNTIVPGVSVMTAEELPRNPSHITPPTSTHVKGCSITRCALIDAVPLASQPGTREIIVSSTPTNSPVPHTQPPREETSTKAEPLQNKPTTLPDPDAESGVALDQGQSSYLSIPSMLSRLRRHSASSIYSVESYRKLAAGMKSEASLRLRKV